MPKTKAPDRTRAEELRHIAGLSSRKPDDARAAWEAFQEEVEAVRQAAEAWESADLSGLSGQLGTLFEALSSLSEAGLSIDGLDDLQEAYEYVQAAEGSLGLDSDSLDAFTEAYDELEQALDTYDEYRETGSGYNREDREQAWETVTEQMEALAEAADALGFDWTPTPTPEAEQSPGQPEEPPEH
jgi:tetratricopeptide (TPR) repeat protein